MGEYGRALRKNEKVELLLYMFWLFNTIFGSTDNEILNTRRWKLNLSFYLQRSKEPKISTINVQKQIKYQL